MNLIIILTIGTTNTHRYMLVKEIKLILNFNHIFDHKHLLTLNLFHA